MKKIRFGIVGTGNIAHRFADAIQHTEEAELTAVASRTKENADRFAEEYNIPVRFGSYEEMAVSDAIDAAYIAVPHSGHMDCSRLMMNGGKHVLCEKPLALNEKQVRAMFDCADKNRVFLMEAMWARLVPGTLRLLDMVRDGVLGEIRGAEGKFCYTMDEDEMGHHVLKNENGGGALLDVGVYALHFARWFLGSDIESVQAVCDTYKATDSHTCILLKYNNGAVADLSCATLLKKPNEGYLYGTKGYVRLERFYAPQKLEFHPDNGDVFTVDTPYEGNGFEEQIRHVCRCIGENRTESPVLTRALTLEITKQMDAIRRQIHIQYPQDAE